MAYSTSIINRYFCKQFLVWLGIVVFFLTAVIGIFESIEMLRRGMSRPDIPLHTIFEMVLLKLPSQIQLLLPFIILLTGLLCFWRLQQSKESLAFQAMGYSIWQFIRGISLLCLALGMLNISIILPLTSAFTTRLAYLEEVLFYRQLHRLSVGASGIWLKEKQKDKYMIIHAESFLPKEIGLKNAIFYTFKDDNTFVERIDANQAILRNSKTWEIYDQKNIDGENIEVGRAKMPKHILPSTLSQEQLKESHVPPQAISFWSLPKTINMLKKAGMATVAYELFWHKQIAKVLMFIAMIVVAVVFSFHFERNKSHTMPIVLALVFGFCVHFFSDIVYVMGLSQRLPIWIAAWIPPFLTLLIGVALLLQKEDVK